MSSRDRKNISTSANDKRRNLLSNAFWNRTFEMVQCSPELTNVKTSSSVEETAFWTLIGDIRGLEVLDVGCGVGDDTIRCLQRGAHTTAIDLSPIAVARVQERISKMGLSADVRRMSAFDIGQIGKTFDLIIGRYILHHLEPFANVGGIFVSCLKPNGRMVFFENNANNSFLMFAREHLAGRFGIPRYGDDLENPLTREEVNLLSDNFEDVRSHFPSLVFVRKVNTYIFRLKEPFKPLIWTFDKLDDLLWFLFPSIRKYSYHQIITAEKPKPSS